MANATTRLSNPEIERSDIKDREQSQCPYPNPQSASEKSEVIFLSWSLSSACPKACAVKKLTAHKYGSNNFMMSGGNDSTNHPSLCRRAPATGRHRPLVTQSLITIFRLATFSRLSIRRRFEKPSPFPNCLLRHVVCRRSRAACPRRSDPTKRELWGSTPWVECD